MDEEDKSWGMHGSISRRLGARAHWASALGGPWIRVEVGNN